jgi:hypothetical protein
MPCGLADTRAVARNVSGPRYVSQYHQGALFGRTSFFSKALATASETVAEISIRALRLVVDDLELESLEDLTLDLG